MNELRISRDAWADLQGIWDYIAQESEAAADRMTDEITAMYETLRDFPGMGRTHDELSPGLRSFAVRNYVIFYREIEAAIEIARVIHGARNLSRLFGQEEV